MTRIKDLPTFETIETTNWIAVDSNLDEEASGKASPATISAFVNSDLSPLLSLVEGTGITISGDPQNPTITADQGGGDMYTDIYDPQNISSDAFARGNHTGFQGIETITGLQDSLDEKTTLPIVKSEYGVPPFNSVFGLQSDDNVRIGYSGSGADYTVSIGDIISAQEFRYEVADSNATDFHIETVGGVKLLAIANDGAFHLRQFGVLGDGVTDDSALINLAASSAIEMGVSLRDSVEDTYFLGSQIDLRYIPGADLEGSYLYDNEDMIPVLVGASSNNRFNYTIKIRTIIWSGATGVGPTRTLPNQPMLRIVGAKNSNIYYGDVDYVDFYTDTDDATTSSNAYLNVYPQQSELLTLTANPDTSGSSIQWNNEIKFFGGRLRKIVVEGTYNHNHNIWYSPTIETNGGADFLVGNSNRILNARLENTGIVFNFSSETYNNLVTRSWTSTARDGLEPYGGLNITVNDEGVGNQVITDRMAYIDRAVMFSLQFGPNNLASATGQFGVTSGNLIKSGNGWTASVGQLYESPWVKCSAGAGFDINCDQPVFSVRISFYDDNANLITSATDPGLLSGQGFAWDGVNNRYARSVPGDLPSAPLIMTSEGWCVLSLVSTATTIFRSLEVVGLAPYGSKYTTIGSMQPKFVSGGP